MSEEIRGESILKICGSNKPDKTLVNNGRQIDGMNIVIGPYPTEVWSASMWRWWIMVLNGCATQREEKYIKLNMVDCVSIFGDDEGQVRRNAPIHV